MLAIRRTKILLLASSIAVIAGCSADQETPLIFGQLDSYGLSFNAGTAAAGASLSVGYTGRNVAIIPVSYNKGNGSRCRVEAAGPGFRDALSVFGQFEASSGPGEGQQGNEQLATSLGKFFATGLAASNISDGFAAKLGLKRSDRK